MTANVYDTLCSTDTFDVNVTSLADDVITAAKFDESTAYPLKSADTGSTQVARVGADSDTLETLSDEIAAVKAETALILADTGTDGVVIAGAQTVATVTNLTNLPTMPTDWVTAAGVKADAVTKIQSGLALEATLTAIKGAGWSTETLAAIDVLIDAIKAKSDLIPAQPAAIGSAMTLTSAYDKAKDDVLTPLGVVDGIVDAIKAKTDTIPASPAQAGEYTAAIAAIPTTPLLAANYTAPDNASISAIKAKTDTIPASPAVAGEYTASIAAIQADLDNPNQYKADVSGIPDAILAKVVVDTLTLKQVLKVLAAIEIGTTTGGGTASFTYTGKDGTTVQLTGVDEDGNRTAVVVTPGA